MSTATLEQTINERPLTRHEYHLLSEAGAFEGKRVELIGGVIYEKEVDEKIIEPRAHLLTRREYQLLTQAGAFEGRRVELIEGVIYEKMAAMLSPHASACRKVDRLFQAAFSGQAAIGLQLPIVLNDNSEPEPDLSLARGSDADYDDHNPLASEVLLALEVSDSTLSIDRRTKASAYARAQIVEYWILNIEERQLEIHRGPQQDSAMPLGWGYSTRLIVPESGRAATLWKPNVEFAVADLLPHAPTTPVKPH